jgi:hypothetical protein
VHSTDLAPVVDGDSHGEAWAKTLTRFSLVGNLCGFSFRNNQDRAAFAFSKAMSQDDWQLCRELMQGAGVLYAPKGKRPAQWAEGWSHSRFRAELKYHRLSINFPDCEPPEINLSGKRGWTPDKLKG